MFPRHRHKETTGLIRATRAVGPGKNPSAVARALLRELLSDIDGNRAPASWDIVKDQRGKPFVAGTDLHISLSHTRHRVAAAVSRYGPVGIDIESADRRIADPHALARRFFTPDEVHVLEACPDEAGRRQTFLKLWTLKEAVVKASGTGIAETLTAFSVALVPVPSLTIHAPELPDAGCWQLHQELTDGHWVALAVIRAADAPSPA